MVERFIPGVDCRLLVVGDEMIAASRGEPEMVVADGTSTVVELIEAQLNSDPRRGNLETCLLDRINTDDWEPVVLHDLINQGYQPESVPPAGVRILVARFANWAIDITDEVHPTVREHAVIAAKVAGLDICGIDIVCVDISQPLESQGGAIVEINASPSLLMHLEPVIGKPRPVGEAIISMLFPTGENGRVPVIGITGTHGGTGATRQLAHLLKASGNFLGLCNGDGFQFGARHVVSKQGDRMFGTHGVLMYPWTEIAVCETSADSILQEGLGYDHCQIGVVLHVDSACSDVAERATEAERCVVTAVLPAGTAVLNADDPRVADMAESCRGSVLWFTLDAGNPVVAAWRATGGRAVIVRDGLIVLADGSAERGLCRLSELPQPPAGQNACHNACVLAAVGAAWAYGLDDAALAEGLRTMPSGI